MKGFLSFLLAFVFLSAILLAMNSYSISQTTDYREALILEKKYYLEQNYLHLLLNTFKKSAQTASAIHSNPATELLETMPEKHYSQISQILESSEQELIYTYVSLRLAELELYVEANSGDWELDYWCGPSPTKETSELLLKQMASQKTALKCPSCQDLSSPYCAKHYSITPEGDIQFNSNYLNQGAPGYGFSLYSKKYGIASISHIPYGHTVSY